MNKANLKAKWGKYCDTDKLVDDMMSLLKYYGHRNSEHGVCVILNEYFTNKEPLIKLFMESNHYIGNMRIATKRDFERAINAKDIWTFCNNFPRLIGAEERLMHYTDADGKTMTDYIVTGQKKVDIKTFKADDANQKKLGSFNWNTGATQDSYNNYTDFITYIDYFKDHPYAKVFDDISALDIVKGTKTSRAFNKMCVHYEIDKAEGYNKLFAQYADLVSDNVRKLYFVISLNPLDYLTMSNGNSWTSCHRIGTHMSGSGCGQYCGGCMSYMMDSSSIITYVVNSIEEPLHKEGKIYRQMYHYNDSLLIQSRLYPQGNDGASNLYDKFRGFMCEEFSELLNLSDSSWEYKKGTRAVGDHMRNVGAHYPDTRYNSSVGIFYPSVKKNTIDDNVIQAGHDSWCPYCGKATGLHSTLSHNDCEI